MEKNQRIEIDLRHALLMVARALDYVGVDDINHGHRVAYMAYECAKKMGWDEEKAKFAYYTGLIHDCGVSSTREHSNLVGALEPEGERAHCEKGYQELSKCPLLQPFSLPVRYHHTQWRDLVSMDISEYDRDIAAIVYLADRVDFLRVFHVRDQQHESITLYKDDIALCIKEQAGIMFNPEMVVAMEQLIHIDGFWYNMETAYIEVQALTGDPSEGYNAVLSVEQIIHLARFLARIVDAKSPFTYQHSEKVALLARMLATDLNFASWQQKLIYVAGLLHDIGKLRTPDEILNKGIKLNRDEYTRIRRHTVDTEHTLRSFFPGSDIGRWAANHHERLDGSGYPYNHTAAQLDLPSRIIAIADTFQALSQKRPYRKVRLSVEEILHRMTPLAENGQIDGDVFAIIRDNAQRYYQASVLDD